MGIWRGRGRMRMRGMGRCRGRGRGRGLYLYGKTKVDRSYMLINMIADWLTRTCVRT